MSTYFVSRHKGALDWALHQGLTIDHWVDHIDPLTITTGDKVIGTLPIQVVAAICDRGALYWHLSLDLLPESRGQELTAAQMQRCHARLERFQVTQLPPLIP